MNRALNGLFKRIDEPISIPEKQDRFKIEAAPDINPHVLGSVAGANSSDFHIYRSYRRKEYTRMQVLEEQAKEATEQQDFREKAEARRQEEEARTLKRRAKRQKEKMKKKSKVSNEGHSKNFNEVKPDASPKKSPAKLEAVAEARVKSKAYVAPVNHGGAEEEDDKAKQDLNSKTSVKKVDHLKVVENDEEI